MPRTLRTGAAAIRTLRRTCRSGACVSAEVVKSDLLPWRPPPLPLRRLQLPRGSLRLRGQSPQRASRSRAPWRSLPPSAWCSSGLAGVDGASAHLNQVEPDFLRGVSAGTERIELRRYVLEKLHPDAPRRDDLPIEVIGALSWRIALVIGPHPDAAWTPQGLHCRCETKGAHGRTESARTNHRVVAGRDRLVESQRAQRKRACGYRCRSHAVNGKITPAWRWRNQAVEERHENVLGLRAARVLTGEDVELVGRIHQQWVFEEVPHARWTLERGAAIHGCKRGPGKRQEGRSLRAEVGHRDAEPCEETELVELLGYLKAVVQGRYDRIGLEVGLDESRGARGAVATGENYGVKSHC